MSVSRAGALTPPGTRIFSVGDDLLLNATITERQDLTPSLCIVRVALDKGEHLPFEPGQFCMLGLPRLPVPGAPLPGVVETVGPPRPAMRLVQRSYSVASSGDERRFREFYLVLVEKGQLTPRLWPMKPGDRLWMSEKAEGFFTLECVPADKDLVMVATGTAIGPYISMLRTFLARGEKRWRRFIVIHGTRLADDLGYQGELEEIAKNEPSVLYFPIVTREPDESKWKGMRGRVQAMLDPHVYQKFVGEHLSPHNSHVFLCGNPDMIKETETHLVARGFTVHSRAKPGNIHYERYW